MRHLVLISQYKYIVLVLDTELERVNLNIGDMCALFKNLCVPIYVTMIVQIHFRKFIGILYFVDKRGVYVLNNIFR